ncbi:MAG: VanZ family protein [bacterium]
MKARVGMVWAGVVLYYLLILCLSSVPGEALASLPQFAYMDKLVHISLYAIFGFLLGGTRTRAVVLLLLGAALSGFDEFYQHWIPGRFPDVYDWMMDVAGVSLGLWLARRFFCCEK